MVVLLGLAAAAFYGAGDFFGGLAGRRSPVLPIAFVSQALGIPLIVVAAFFLPGHATPAAFLLGLGAGACAGIGIALLYYALSIGTMGIVSPVTAVLAATLPVAIGMLHGERLGLLRVTGIVIALTAVVLISRPAGANTTERSSKSIACAVLSGLTLGGFYVFLAAAGKDAGIYPLLAARCASSAVIFAGVLIARHPIVPPKAAQPLTALTGTLDVSANALYLYAADAGFLSIAAVLTSLYPVATVVLARVVLGERLGTAQKIGVACALAGVALIAA